MTDTDPRPTAPAPSLHRGWWALVLATAACVPPAPPQPAPAPTMPAPRPPAPRPTPTPANWQDWPWTPGTWRYAQDPRGSRASFGPASGDPLVVWRCDRAQRAIILSRAGAVAAPFTIRTSATTRTVATQRTGGALPYVAARFAVDDRLLDAMIFSRGRFTIEQPGAAPLVLPPWAEIARVTEDCRG